VAEAVGALILTAAGVEGATALTTTIVGTVAITAASVGLSLGANALLAKQTTSDERQNGQLTTRQPTPSRRRNYGRMKVGGATIFSEVEEVLGIVTLFRLVAINEGEIDAFEQFWLDDNYVLLSGATSGLVLGAYMVGAASFAAMDSRVGLPTETDYGILTTNFPSIWGADYRGDGIASVLLETGQPTNFDNFTTAYPGGTPPNPRVVARFVKVWDPRDGGHDKDDPSTWTWTDNPVLIALDFHRHADGLGLAVLDSTLLTVAALAEWSAAATICEETVGGIARYRCGGGYSIAEDAPADVLASILATCDGQTYLRGDGGLGIRVGKTVSPSITLTDDHILGYSDLKKGDNVFLACNEVTAKYTSPDHDYQVVDADPWRDEADITDRGQVLTKAISLPWVQNHSQARRLMKIAHARFNPEWSGTIITDMAGLALLNERYVHLTISEVDVDGSALNLIDGDFEILPDSIDVSIGETGITCRIGVSSIDQNAYDWNEGTEAGGPPAIPSDE